LTGLIIRDSNNQNHTSLKNVIISLADIIKKYNWFLGDYECSVYPSTKIPETGDFVWLSGEEFVLILEKHEIQFIWGVALAYAKGIELKEILSHPRPFADGNEAFWKPELTMQNPLAEIEIISWDSTMLLVIAKSKELIEMFIKEYPNSLDLKEYNQT